MSVTNPRRPRIIPVLDIMNGVVVRAVGGRRSEYRPIESKLTRSTKPLDVAKALVDATGANELYVADLDEIQGRGSNLLTVRRMPEELPVAVWVDFGYAEYPDIAKIPLNWLPDVKPVIASETALEPLYAIVSGIDFAPHGAFSIDVRGDRLLGRWEEWRTFGVTHGCDVVGMAKAVNPFRTRILIDLGSVGVNRGPATEHHCRAIREALPDVELIAGGGVRGWDDVHRLGEAGADAVLVASALHDGRLP